MVTIKYCTIFCATICPYDEKSGHPVYTFLYKYSEKDLLPFVFLDLHNKNKGLNVPIFADKQPERFSISPVDDRSIFL